MSRNIIIASSEEITDEESWTWFWTEGEINKRLDCHTLEELGVELGLFKNKSDARKNGMSGPIPVGISETGTKKRKVLVWRHPKHFQRATHEAWWRDFWKETNPLLEKLGVGV